MSEKPHGAPALKSASRLALASNWALPPQAEKSLGRYCRSIVAVIASSSIWSSRAELYRHGGAPPAPHVTSGENTRSLPLSITTSANFPVVLAVAKLCPCW